MVAAGFSGPSIHLSRQIDSHWRSAMNGTIPLWDRADQRSIFSMLNSRSRPGRNDSMTTEISVAKPPMDGDNVAPPFDPPPPDSPNKGPETTFSLVLRARAGDRAALDELCVRYLPRL